MVHVGRHLFRYLQNTITSPFEKQCAPAVPKLLRLQISWGISFWELIIFLKVFFLPTFISRFFLPVNSIEDKDKNNFVILFWWKLNLYFDLRPSRILYYILTPRFSFLSLQNPFFHLRRHLFLKCHLHHVLNQNHNQIVRINHFFPPSFF